MQRINLFPNPVFAGPLTDVSHWGDANGTVRDNALHVTGRNGGYGFNVKVPFNVPLVLLMRVDASEDNVAGVMLIQATDKPDVNNMLVSQRFKRGISDVLCRFTVPSHGFRFEVNPNGIRDVAVSNVLIERADTYDPAVGGASGLLHGRHDATRLTPAAGVMQDDDNQHGQKSVSQHHRITQRESDHSMRSVDGRRRLSGQHIRQRQWRHSLIGFADYRQIKEGQLVTDDDCNSDQFSSRFRRAIRHTDRHRDQYAHLHACRLSGEQDPARQHQIFHRGYDAARLTLLGVVA